MQKPSTFLLLLFSLLICLATISDASEVRLNKFDNEIAKNYLQDDKQEIITNCEDTINIFAESANYAHENKSLMIVIFRQGKNEKKKIVERRFADLKNFGKSRKIGDLGVFAIGERAKRLGRADFYVKGVLFKTIYYGKNSISACNGPF